MSKPKYLSKPVSIKGSKLAIVALSREGSPLALEKAQIRGVEEYDIYNCFPLMPLLARKAEAQEEVPDLKDVKDAIAEAKSLI